MKSFTFTQEAGRNFTPSSVIHRWAVAQHLAESNTRYFEHLVSIGGAWYKYHHFHIEEVAGIETVTIFLEVA